MSIVVPYTEWEGPWCRWCPYSCRISCLLYGYGCCHPWTCHIGQLKVEMWLKWVKISARARTFQLFSKSRIFGPALSNKVFDLLWLSHCPLGAPIGRHYFLEGCCRCPKAWFGDLLFCSWGGGSGSGSRKQNFSFKHIFLIGGRICNRLLSGVSWPKSRLFLSNP